MKNLNFSAFQSKPSLYGIFRAFIGGRWTVKLATFVGVLLVVVALLIIVAVGGAGALPLDGLIFLLFLMAIGFGIIFDAAGRVRQSILLATFAKDNKGEFVNDLLATGIYSGLVFGSGVVRITAAVRLQGATTFEIGNYMVMGAGGGIAAGYFRITLPTKLPHMLLVSQSRSFVVPADITSGQHLSLEGNFDQHFKLYVPKGYEQDALYVFTPDVMELFMANTGNYSCEIIDDQLFLYSAMPLKLTQQEPYIRLTNLMERMSAKFNRQIDGYRDGRIDSQEVAAGITPSNRLKGGLSAFSLSVVIICIIGGYIVLSRFIDFSSVVLSAVIVPVIAGLLVMLIYRLYSVRLSKRKPPQ